MIAGSFQTNTCTTRFAPWRATDIACRHVYCLECSVLQLRLCAFLRMNNKAISSSALRSFVILHIDENSLSKNKENIHSHTVFHSHTAPPHYVYRIVFLKYVPAHCMNCNEKMQIIDDSQRFIFTITVGRKHRHQQHLLQVIPTFFICSDLFHISAGLLKSFYNKTSSHPPIISQNRQEQKQSKQYTVKTHRVNTLK